MNTIITKRISGKNRIHICKECGSIRNLPDRGRDVASGQKCCCGCNLIPLSHEQSYVATHLNLEKCKAWIQNGGHILRGPARKKKRWVAAVKEEDIITAKEQQRTYRKRKPRNFGYQVPLIDLYIKGW